MNVVVICLAVLASGSNVGWERRSDDGMEYIIQLSPQEIDALKAGSPLGSDIPAQAGNVRSYRICTGNDKLPKDDPPIQSQQPTVADAGGKKTVDSADSSNTSPDDPKEPSKPWLPFTCTLLGLIASLVANVYIGWIAYGFRQRIPNSSFELPNELPKRSDVGTGDGTS